MSTMNYTFEAIGHIESPFKEKFGIPRQSQLVPEARSILRLRPSMRDALTGLEGFSHVWVLFVFHDNMTAGWNPLVRPPRLGGTRKMGVFATRAPHRPNPIGMSLVRIDRVDHKADPPAIHISGGDFLDGTPVLDLKPHLPDSDRAAGEVRTGWLEEAPRKPPLEVGVTAAAHAILEHLAAEGYPELEVLLTSMLRLDPRPAFQQGEDARYAARVLDFDIHWEMRGTVCRVFEIRDLRDESETAS